MIQTSQDPKKQKKKNHNNYWLILPRSLYAVVSYFIFHLSTPYPSPILRFASFRFSFRNHIVYHKKENAPKEKRTRNAILG